MRHRRPWGIGAAGLLIATTTVGCVPASHYYPRGSQVALVQTSSGQRYMKRGRTYDAGILFDDLDQAVSDDPAALARARDAQSDTRMGLVVMIGGEVCALGAVGYDATARVSDASYRTSDRLVAGGVACLVGMFVGMYIFGDGMAERLDAINVYNDHVTGAAP